MTGEGDPGVQGGGSAAPAAERSRVLIADGDEVLLRTVAWLLRSEGYEVDVSPCGARFFERVDRFAPDVVLIDAMMPGVEGTAVIERLARDNEDGERRILVMSSVPDDRMANRFLLLGAHDLLRKPFHMRELLARLHVQLKIRAELRRAREELRHAEAELHRVRAEAESRRKLVDILHEVSGDFTPDELSHLLVRRVARALNITHCSLVLAHPGDRRGIVATSYENPTLRNLEIGLDRYPEIRAALDRNEPVLISDVRESPLYEHVRAEWERNGTAAPVRSVVALPFVIDGRQSGVFVLRTTTTEPALTPDDVEFADEVVRAAVSAIRRARAIELSRADNARLEMLALTDPLTLALNRRALMDGLSAELERARRYALVLSILMVDIDHFKDVNDRYGHLAGDEVLRCVVRVLQREARSVDFVARYGGEEFVVVLPETSAEGAFALAERICARVREEPIETPHAATPLHVTVSIGVATVPSPQVESTDDLIALADAALYRAKREGRDRVCT
ncbi:MAG TPA: diguanylate cyclase [Gemmatimonadaceae bacterium]|nr:diguanylate cyclase [Gemmatimonadaceae bacterium]